GDLNPPVDPETELPAQFSERRLRASESAIAPSVRKLLLRSEARRAKGDTSGAVAALEEATAADSTLKDAFRVLGMLYEEEHQYDKARGAYERTLKNNPNDFVALNNLAYAIAVRDHKPADALPLAEHAYTLARGAAMIADTLGWIKHLLGDDAAALPLLEAAAKGSPANADVQLHVAVVYAVAGRLQDAAKALQAAKAADPAVEQREEYQTVRKRIGGPTS
ncbi:MAG TPA: tetratricopeptide repeat protein, partial [Vicinamibacterales bacterium]|nr:tetratricopeptide repeat protein [Vicinamibacterales bacterium]